MEKLNIEKNPLVELSKWNKDKHYLKRQIGFNSLFLLDNACMSMFFIIEKFLICKNTSSSYPKS